MLIQSETIKKLVSLLLETDSKRRITAEELVETTFVKCEDLHLSVFELAPTLMRYKLAQKNHLSIDRNNER